MMYLAFYIDCMMGRFIPYGPFDTALAAREWADKQVEPKLYAVLAVLEVREAS